MDLRSANEIHDCTVQPRKELQRRMEKVLIGCGAGFGGDRPLAALKLLQRVEDLNYMILECLAERTLADRYLNTVSGGDGYDSRISEWMLMLLPLAVERGVCIITNMGALDPCGAQDKVLEISRILGIGITVAVAHEVVPVDSGPGSPRMPLSMKAAASTYLGAAPIVDALEKFSPDVVITSRVADASLFLAPMVYELGWDWSDMNRLAQGVLAGHLLECGCQLTGGYFMHPGDDYRNMSPSRLLNLSLPFAEVAFDGRVCVRKAEGSGGLLDERTCAQQLLYEIGDPSAYITPDVTVDVRDVSFRSLSADEVLCSGAKPSFPSTPPSSLLQLVPQRRMCRGWGEISYCGMGSVARAEAAEFLVRSWLEESRAGLAAAIRSCIVGVDSTVACDADRQTVRDVRLHMDGLFDDDNLALLFTNEFLALYTNGPAGGGGIRTGHNMEIFLEKQLIRRGDVLWESAARGSDVAAANPNKTRTLRGPFTPRVSENVDREPMMPRPAPSGKEVHLYSVAHCRAGDKGNDLNFSVIPHFLPDITRLETVITPTWVSDAVAPLVDLGGHDAVHDGDGRVTVEIYRVPGIRSLNVVVRNILDGGVCLSRRIDRHGKTLSDFILTRKIILP